MTTRQAFQKLADSFNDLSREWAKAVGMKWLFNKIFK